MSRPLGYGCVICGGGCTQLENAIGCIKAIQQIHKVKFDEIRGTSAGAIVGSVLMSFEQDLEKLENLIKETDINEWFTINPFSVVKSLFGKSDHIADHSGLRNALQKYTTKDSWEKVKVAISEMKDGKFVKAHLVGGRPLNVLASMSFQHVFPPVVIGGKEYQDGGVNDNIPIPTYLEIAKYEHLYIILAPATPLLPSIPRWKFLDRLFNTIDNTMNRELAQIEQLHLEELPNVSVLKPEKWVDSAKFLDWSENFEQIDASYELAKSALLQTSNANQASFPVLGGN